MNDSFTDSVEMRIIQVLDKIRPFIQRDGGDCKLEKFEDGVVYIRFFGACLGCSIIDTTLYDGIESILKEEIPEVVKVVNVDNIETEYDNIEDN